MVAKGVEVATIPDTNGEVSEVPLSEVEWRNYDFRTAFTVIPTIVSGEDYFGDGFQMLTDKSVAVGKEFLIIDWAFITDQTTGREYASIRLITAHNALIRMNDGSTGIYKQLKMLESKGIHGGVHCVNGLRVSEYMFEDEKGNRSQAKTYYLA